MASTQTDRIGTVDSSKAIKVPCRVATTADLTPSLSGGALGSGGGGLFTIDGVALAAGDRVLVKNQADQTTNGIYVAASTAWQRATDFQDNRAVVSGTIVLVTNGTASAGLWFELTTANPITIGSSNITFAVTSNPSVSSAMAPVVGAATLAQARTAMAVSGLGDNNTFAGTDTFNGAATFNSAVTFSSTAAFNGAVTATAGETISGAALVMTSQPINEAQGANIASAATTDIGAATGNYVKVTGTTTITAFGTVQAGTRRLVEFTGALTLTHNTSSLILPGGANITTAAGDVGAFVSEGSGNWRCTGYLKAGNAPISASPITNSVGANIGLNNTGTYFDGPSVAQGTLGTWLVFGQVTVRDTTAAATMDAKLHDGTTIIDSGRATTGAAQACAVIHLSGVISAPAGNLRISVKDSTAISGAIISNDSGNSKDSTITAIRIA